MDRREFSTAFALTTAGTFLTNSQANAQEAPHRKFTLDLCPGRIGVNSDAVRTIELAAKFGFESVEPLHTYLLTLSPAQVAELQANLRDLGLVWGAASLSVDFRKDEATFEQGLSELPKIAMAYQTAGVTRVGTHLSPAHEELTYRANFRQHTERLGRIADILGEHGLRLGLEYVGPRNSWTRRRYAFIHTMVETMELIAEIKRHNIGLVLDSWHWYTAEEDVAALRSLANQDVVAVDLNDAPAGIAVQEQIDNRRELPMASGVIDMKGFLAALIEMGYDGPVRAEPFNQALNALDDAAAVEATGIAMKKAFKLVE